MHVARIQKQYGPHSNNMILAPAVRAHGSAINDTNGGNTMEVFCELIFLIRAVEEFNLMKVSMPPESRTLSMMERFITMIGLYLRVGPNQEVVGSHVNKGLTLTMPLRIHIKMIPAGAEASKSDFVQDCPFDCLKQ